MNLSKFVVAGVVAAGLGLATAGTASAQWGYPGGPYHHHHYYGYPRYYGAYAAPVVVAPRPVVVTPPPVVAPAAVVAPAPAVYGYPGGVYGGVGIYRPGFSLGLGFWR